MYGLEGALEATLTPDPNLSATWQFVAVAEKTVQDAEDVKAPTTDVHRIAPGYSGYLVVVKGAQATLLPQAEAEATEVLGSLPTEDLTDPANSAVSSVPLDPRGIVLALVHELSSIQLPALPKDPRGDDMQGHGAAALPLPPARTAAAADPPIPALTVHDETLGRGDLDLVPLEPARADATLRNSALAPLAGLVQLLPTLDRTVLAAAAAAVLSILLLAPPLYHRLHRHQLLDHGARAKLYELVTARPGIHIEELARASGCSRSTAVYHLRLLARNGYVLAVGSAKSVHYYPNNGHQDVGEREQRALLSSRRTRAIADLVAAHPGISRNDLSATVGVSPSTLSWHLGRLLEKGLVEDRLTPSGRALYPSARLAELLRPWSREATVAPASERPAQPPADPPTMPA